MKVRYIGPQANAKRQMVEGPTSELDGVMLEVSPATRELMKKIAKEDLAKSINSQIDIISAQEAVQKKSVDTLLEEKQKAIRDADNYVQKTERELAHAQSTLKAAREARALLEEAYATKEGFIVSELSGLSSSLNVLKRKVSEMDDRLNLVFRPSPRSSPMDGLHALAAAAESPHSPSSTGKSSSSESLPVVPTPVVNDEPVNLVEVTSIPPVNYLGKPRLLVPKPQFTTGVVRGSAENSFKADWNYLGKHSTSMQSRYDPTIRGSKEAAFRKASQEYAFALARTKDKLYQIPNTNLAERGISQYVYSFWNSWQILYVRGHFYGQGDNFPYWSNTPDWPKSSNDKDSCLRRLRNMYEEFTYPPEATPVTDTEMSLGQKLLFK